MHMPRKGMKLRTQLTLCRYIYTKCAIQSGKEITKKNILKACVLFFNYFVVIDLSQDQKASVFVVTLLYLVAPFVEFHL